MKKIKIIVMILAVLLTFLSGCADSVVNKITFKNFALSKVYVNFRASVITIEAGSSIEVTDIPKGTYSYDTNYDVPIGTVTSTTDGAVTGEVNLDAGTKILVIYSSSFDDVNGVYTLSATISSSDATSSGDPTSP